MKNIVKLSDLMIDGSYGILPSSNDYNENNPVSLIRATELKKDFEIDFDSAFKVEYKYYNKRVRLQKEDVLIAVKGATIGSNKCIGYISEEVENVIINGSIFRIQVDKAKVIPKYLAFILSTDLCKKQMKYNLVANNAIDYLDKNLISNILVPVPDFEVQKEIIEIMEKALITKKEKENSSISMLEKIDNHIENELNLNQRLNNTKEKSNKTFFRDFNQISGNRFDPFYYLDEFYNLDNILHNMKYKCTKLRNICEKITDGTHKTPMYTDDGVKFISVKDIKNFEINFDNTKYIDEEEHEEFIKRCNPESGDILLTKIGTIGKAVVVPEHHEKFSIFVSVALLKLKGSTINPYYLAAFLNSRLANIQMQRHLKGVGVPDLHLEDIEDINVIIPDLEIQKEIAEEVQKMIASAQKLKWEAEEAFSKAKSKVEHVLIK